MRLLFINQTYYPDISATAQQLTDLCGALVQRGHSVRVLCDRKDYFDTRRLHAPSERHEGVEIIRVRGIDLGGASRLRRIGSALFLNAAMAMRLFRERRPDVVVALTSPPLVAAAAALWAWLRGVPFVYWIMDLNPDQAIAAGWLREGSLRARVLGAILRRTLQSSARIVVLDRFMAERVGRYGIDMEKIAIHPPWPLNEDAVAPVSRDQNSFLKEQQLEGSFVVMYSGNHSICHPLDTVLEAAKALQNEPDIRFVFVGGGERVRDVAQFRAAHGLTNIVQLPYQPRAMLSHSLSAADVHLVVMGEPYVGIVHPCKIYGVIQVRRPTIFLGPRNSHLGEMVESCALGAQVEHGDTAGMVAAIRRFRDQPEIERSRRATHLASLADQHFNRQRLMGALVETLETVDVTA